MTILYSSAAPVKTERRFGAGILPTYPVHTAPYTSADLEWLAADDRRREAEDRRFDAMAEESAYLDRHEAGIVC